MKLLVGSPKMPRETLERYLGFSATIVGPAPEPATPGFPRWGWIVDVEERDAQWLQDRLSSGLYGSTRVIEAVTE